MTAVPAGPARLSRSLFVPRVAFLLGPMIALLPVLAWSVGQALSSPVWGSLLTPVIVFGVIGVLDAVIGVDRSNPDPETARALRQDPWLKAIPLLALPVCGGLVLWGAWVVTQSGLPWPAGVGTTLSVGIATGALGITAAHELIHKDTRFERAAGGLLLSLVCYGTFKVEHIRGHHVTVSTPEDRSSAQVGQSLYAFLPSSIAGNMAAAWRLETVRLGRRALPVCSVRNEVLVLALVSVAIAALLTSAWGVGALGFFLGQSVVAIVLLEIVNYIQHYGLRRQRLADGRYERTTMQHSWNSPYRVTNWFLFNLQRHSDHHAYAHRWYGELRHFDDSPQMPAGYAAMVLMALVPPLWSKVMDPRVSAYYADGSRSPDA